VELHLQSPILPDGMQEALHLPSNRTEVQLYTRLISNHVMDRTTVDGLFLFSFVCTFCRK
jgi:hypothetical protein